MDSTKPLPPSLSVLSRRRTDMTSATFTPSSVSSVPSDTASHSAVIGPKLPPVTPEVQVLQQSSRELVPEVAFCSDRTELDRSAEILYVSGLGPLIEIVPNHGSLDLGYIMTRLGGALRRILVLSGSLTLGSIGVERAVALLHFDVDLTSSLAVEGLATVEVYHPDVLKEEHSIEIYKSFEAKDGSSGCCALIAYRDAVRVLRYEKKSRVLMVKRAGRLGVENSVTIKCFIEALLGDVGCVKHVLMLPSRVSSSYNSDPSSTRALSYNMAAPETGFLVFTDDLSPLRALSLTRNGDLIVRPGVSLRFELYDGCDFAQRDTLC
ncbi:hypothetical protein Pmar_PMAR002094 [Perkinsus marinus ATCC 50983]|uniref:Uncharacterized protein n=1 Tax=Perkinsus marinus (strain ATCC 50983 / TXsc) TaxID=423536 RepID=C5LYN5_PERM5|nr:hypothetical protein Pmar_PMAR002094 [Perkinsus marinus ATCC 50983]EEQ98273.1 hypothetical protein Pmar_PMAR002094 [Perkinsus marinus ATCC 50983]|eukprot:XP_002765556.1 hypothetical protein Pmar_PMAR002094 [Perkinsus marinus ATCC 50983]